jgi:competence ComEA-like helix-hairpin-helix protein
MVLPSPNPVPDFAKPDRFAAWSRPVQTATVALAGFFLAILMMRGASFLPTSTRPLEIDTDLSPQFRLDLNAADRPTLLQVPGVGEKMADRIISFREANGPFQNLQQLLQVQGIGSATLERWRPWIEVRTPSPGIPIQVSTSKKQSFIPRVDGSVNSGSKIATKVSGTPAKTDSLSGPIPINTASLEELQKLPRVGLKRAQQIIDERTKSPFRDIEDLKRVPGIGVKTLESLRPWIMLDKVEQKDTKTNPAPARSGD